MGERTFVNGKVFTGRGEAEFVSAFRVADGRFIWIGDAADVADAAAIDLRGRTVLPGFVDIHTHPTYVAMTVDAIPCIVPAVNDIPGMIAALRGHPNVGKGPDAWIEGWGYDESKLAERRTPTTEDLDLVSTTQPVYVLRSDCHSGICNTRALQLAGITRETPDPDGARFGRYADGEPNGVLQEHAANDVVMRAKSSRDFQGRVDALRRTREHYAERGIVAMTEMMANVTPFDDLEVYRAAARDHGQQVLLYFEWSKLQDNLIPDLTDEQRTGRVRFAGIKMFADGSMSGRTAWVNEAYADSAEHGYPTISVETMQAGYEWARRNRVQVAVHAMGDRALQRVIDFFADKEPWMGPDIPSVRLEHATLLTDDQMRRLSDATMSFGVATQIIFFFAEYESYVGNLTASQFRRAYPLRTFCDRIERLGLSSDAPATTWAEPDDVFVSIQAAVTRKAYNGADIVPEQALTVPQAVLLYTARAATLGRYEEPVGRIAERREANFVVLDRDLFTIEPGAIHETRVAETWMGGEKVFERG